MVGLACLVEALLDAGREVGEEAVDVSCGRVVYSRSGIEGVGGTWVVVHPIGSAGVGPARQRPVIGRDLGAAVKGDGLGRGELSARHAPSESPGRRAAAGRMRTRARLPCADGVEDCPVGVTRLALGRGGRGGG
jgi:hypothetical protein